ncbi:hypothetical protein D3C73_1560970 [compost metagenome]
MTKICIRENTENYIVHFKNNILEGVTEGKLGTAGALATAFVSGFPPLRVVNQEIWRQQRPEVQAFPVVTTVQMLKFQVHLYLD